jgi:hypothetical protein
VEHNRCAQCRNPIRGRQAMVRLARADMSFHGDCWAILNLNVQREYELRAQDEGLDALLGPYNRTETGSWLPTDDTDDAEVVDDAAEDVGDVELSAVPDAGPTDEVHEDEPDHLDPQLPPAVAS